MWGSGFGCLDEDAQANAVDHGSFPGRYWELYEPMQKRIRDCKFYISFEHCNCSSFVTEKFANPLEAGAIPIVNGYKDVYEEQVPRASIIDSDFPSAEHMVKHMLLLLENETAYLEYHRWRVDYHIERMKFQPNCDMCQKLHNVNKNSPTEPKVIHNLIKHRYLQQVCSHQPPKG